MAVTRTRRVQKAFLVALAAAFSWLALAVPVAAVVARLTSLPLGHGAATISWIGTTGIHPKVTSIRGTVRQLPVVAAINLPNYGAGGSPTGSSSTASPSSALGTSIPLGHVHGTLDGAPFTLDIYLQLPSSQPQGGAVQSIGHVTGSFRGEPISATLKASLESPDVTFAGTIGSYKVTGVIGNGHRHGKETTARATFDVSQ